MPFPLFIYFLYCFFKMMKMFLRLSVLVCFFFLNTVVAQRRPIKIVEKEIPNRIALYAVNENEQDFDVKITISGTNFRQSRARPRFVRVPATSKVHLKTIVLVRGKEPNYTYQLEVNDSLSNRALKKEYELIKVRPARPLVVYLTPNCETCDSLLVSLDQSKYIYDLHNLAEKPEIKDQLQMVFGEGKPIDSIRTPIVNVGGKLYTDIDKYEQILEALQKE